MFEELSSSMTMDASDYTAAVDDAAGTTDGLADSASGASDSLFELEPAGIAAGAGVAGVGTGAQGALDDTQSMRETLGRTAVSMGTTTDEANALARELSNATFPIEDATETMDMLAQQGVESEERMIELANASDMIADATGTSAASVAENLAPAIRGLDGDLDGLEDNMDAFTLAVRNTALDTEDLAMTMERSGDELKEMGLESDEAAGLIAAYGEETGKSGRQLRRDFASALREADGDMEAFAEETGIGQDELDAFQQELQNSEGATEEFADSANESLSTWDQIRAGWDDAKLAASGMIGPVDAVAPAMQTAGIAAMTLSTINTSTLIPSLVGTATSLTTMAATAVGTAVPALISVAVAAAPVALPLLAAAAAVAALYVAWDENLFGIQDITEDTLGTVTDIADDVKEAFPGSLEEATDLATDIFLKWHPAGIMWDHRDDILAALPDAQDGRDVADALISGLAEGIEDLASMPVDAVEDMVEDIRDRFPGSDARTGPLSDLTYSAEQIPAITAEEIEAGTPDVSAASEQAVAGAHPAEREAMDLLDSGESRSSRTPSRRPRRRSKSDRVEELLEQIMDVLDAPVELIGLNGEVELEEGHILRIVDGRLQRKVARSGDLGTRGG